MKCTREKMSQEIPREVEFRQRVRDVTRERYPFEQKIIIEDAIVDIVRQMYFTEEREEEAVVHRVLLKNYVTGNEDEVDIHNISRPQDYVPQDTYNIALLMKYLGEGQMSVLGAVTTASYATPEKNELGLSKIHLEPPKSRDPNSDYSDKSKMWLYNFKKQEIEGVLPWKWDFYSFQRIHENIPSILVGIFMKHIDSGIGCRKAYRKTMFLSEKERLNAIGAEIYLSPYDNYYRLINFETGNIDKISVADFLKITRPHRYVPQYDAHKELLELHLSDLGTTTIVAVKKVSTLSVEEAEKKLAKVKRKLACPLHNGVKRNK